MTKFLKFIFFVLLNLSSLFAMDEKQIKRNPLECIKLCNDLQKLIISYLPSEWVPVFSKAAPPEKYSAINMHPNENILAVGFDNGFILLKDLEGKLKNRSFQAFNRNTDLLDNTKILILAFSNDGKYLAAISQSNLIHIWDLKNEKYVNQLEAINPVSSLLSFSSDNKYIFSLHDDYKAKKWEIISGKCIKTLLFNWRTSAVVLSADDKNFIYYVSPSLKITDIETSKKNIELVHDNHGCYELVRLIASNDNNFLYSLNYNGDIYIWDLKNEDKHPIRQIRTFNGCGYVDFLDLALSRDCKYCVAPISGFLRGMKFLNLEKGGELCQEVEMKCSPKLIVFSKNAEYLVIVFHTGQIEIWQNIYETLNEFHNKGYVYDKNIQRQVFLNKQNEQELFDTVTSYNLDRTKKLLDQNENINKYYDCGHTPIIQALRCDNEFFSDLIISSKNFNVNAKDFRQSTPLIYAIWYRRLNVIRKLIEFPNLEVNAQDYKGFTALMHLLANYTDIEFKDFVDKCLDLFLSLPNIDLNIRNNKRDSALDIAYNSGQKNIYNKLLAHSKINAVDFTNMHLLKTLIESKADVDINNKKDDMLSAMFKCNSIDVIKLLADKKKQEEKNNQNNDSSNCVIA